VGEPLSPGLDPLPLLSSVNYMFRLCEELAHSGENERGVQQEGMRFTDYYAEASCTAGRANFITGELPMRTGLTTVGQAGSPLGMPDEAPTIATVFKSMGYAFGGPHFQGVIAAGIAASRRD
jgi:hypothetical protein